MRGVLSEIGFAGATLARICDDGTLMLIDGHLRAETSGDIPIPVLVLDVNEEEADKLLLTFDPIGAMAGADSEKLRVLLESCETSNQDLADMLTALAEEHGIIPEEESDEEDASPLDINNRWSIIVECESEESQLATLDKLTAEGLSCRALIA